MPQSIEKILRELKKGLVEIYIGQGLRSDLERLENGVDISSLIESLKKKAVKEEIISSAIAEAQGSYHAT